MPFSSLAVLTLSSCAVSTSPIRALAATLTIADRLLPSSRTASSGIRRERPAPRKGRRGSTILLRTRLSWTRLDCLQRSEACSRLAWPLSSRSGTHLLEPVPILVPEDHPVVPDHDARYWLSLEVRETVLGVQERRLGGTGVGGGAEVDLDRRGGGAGQW